MTEEERVKQQLEERFGYLKDAVAVKRERRIFAEVPLEKFEEVLSHVVGQMGFDALRTITGMDNGDSFGILYHLSKEGRTVLSLRVRISKDNARVKTVTSFFANADLYEREIMDLLGIEVAGLSPGNRYPLPDNWPKDEYPLRKDWKPSIGKSEVPDE
jgi:NADH:ubiquinone oxidoreductase subunit C